MTKLELEYMLNVNTYSEYVNTTETVHQTIKSGLNSGKEGRLIEMRVKAFLGNYRNKGIAKQGVADTRKNGIVYEIKSGCGELARVDRDGNIKMVKSDYIIYIPEFNIDTPIERQAFVIPTNEFISELNKIGLIRKKMSSAQYKSVECERYHDRVTIQSFKNSNKKYNMLYDLLEQYPLLIELEF